MRPLEPGEFRFSDVPHEAMLLRWTGAIKEKRDQLEGRTKPDKKTGKEAYYPGYRQKGAVNDEHCYVIAVNGALLGLKGLMDGISGLPMPVEATIPVGPWSVQVGQSGKVGQPYRAFRRFIKNQNNSPVPTNSFLDPSYAGVSAIAGCVRLNNEFDDGLGIVVVHNPLARAPLPVGVLGASAEWAAQDVGDAYELRRVI